MWILHFVVERGSEYTDCQVVVKREHNRVVRRVECWKYQESGVADVTHETPLHRSESTQRIVAQHWLDERWRHDYHRDEQLVELRFGTTR